MVEEGVNDQVEGGRGVDGLGASGGGCWVRVLVVLL